MAQSRDEVRTDLINIYYYYYYFHYFIIIIYGQVHIHAKILKTSALLLIIIMLPS